MLAAGIEALLDQLETAQLRWLKLQRGIAADRARASEFVPSRILQKLDDADRGIDAAIGRLLGDVRLLLDAIDCEHCDGSDPMCQPCGGRGWHAREPERSS
jgi:hypothetical protein